MAGPAPRRFFVGLAFALAVALIGCGPSEPVPSLSPGGPATACIGLDQARCDVAQRALAANPLEGSPSYVAIAERFCDGPCPGAERGVWLGHLTVEFADGRQAATILIEVDGQAVTWQPIETVLVRVVPASTRLGGTATGFTLGHCGLASGIDLDGSLWDPVGQIDPDHPDLINSAEASFELTSPSTATLRTAGGAVVELVRHDGPRHLPGCD